MSAASDDEGYVPVLCDPECDMPLMDCPCRGCKSQGYYPPGDDCHYGNASRQGER